MSSRHLRRVALATAAAALMAASPAAADSISFIRDGNVWLTTPDGARQFQVTTSGDYTYASQADDGTFIARVGSAEKLQRLDRFGNVLAEFATPVSDGPTPPGTSTNYFEGPYDPEISPDGTKVAYSYYWQHYTYDPTACGGTGCMTNRLESGTAISYADRLTPWSEFGHLTGWAEPSWFGNDKVVRFNAGVAMSDNAVVNTVNPGEDNDELVRWFTEAYTDERRDGEVNRQGTKLALVDEVAGEPGSYTVHQGIRVYSVENGFDAPPTGCFRWGMETPDEYVHSPSWSPDGNALVWDEEGVLMKMAVGDIAGARCDVSSAAEPVKIVDGARQPDWGPADVPTGRPDVKGPGGDGNGETPGGSPQAVLDLSIAKAKRAKALRKGLTVTIAAPGAGSFSAKGSLGKKLVAKGKATAAAAGQVKLRLRFTGKGRKAVRKVKKARLTVAVTFRPASGAAITERVAVSLKR